MRPMSDRELLAWLRVKISDGADGHAPTPECADPQRILRAATGELPPDETRAIADHAAICPACGEAWHLAREISLDNGIDRALRAGTGARPPRPWFRWGLAAAAAIAVLAIVLPLAIERRPTGPPTMRDRAVYRIESLVAADPLPGPPYRLRWSAGPEGTSYAVSVANERLEVLAEASGLDVAEYVVPEEVLESDPGLKRILWQIEASLPSGETVTSATFVTPIARAPDGDDG